MKNFLFADDFFRMVGKRFFVYRICYCNYAIIRNFHLVVTIC